MLNNKSYVISVNARPVKVRFGVNVTHHCLYRVGRILHDVALAMWSAVGQSLPNRAFWAMSGLPLVATIQQTHRGSAASCQKQPTHRSKQLLYSIILSVRIKRSPATRELGIAVAVLNIGNPVALSSREAGVFSFTIEACRRTTKE